MEKQNMIARSIMRPFTLSLQQAKKAIIALKAEATRSLDKDNSPRVVRMLVRMEKDVSDLLGWKTQQILQAFKPEVKEAERNN